jgi:hypothetical protein
MNSDFQSEILNIANRYVADWFNTKNKEEVKELASKMLDGYKFCTSCFEVSSHIYEIPNTLRPLARGYSFCSPGKVCKKCLHNIAKAYKLVKDEQDRISQGHLRVNINGSDMRNKNGGFTYICRRNDILYKIGASTNLRSRMYGQKFSENNFVCAIHSMHPFELEKYLHNLYKHKRPNKHKELFVLSGKNLEYIKSIKSMNDIPVLCYTNLADATMQKPQK